MFNIYLNQLNISRINTSQDKVLIIKISNNNYKASSVYQHNYIFTTTW